MPVQLVFILTELNDAINNKSMPVYVMKLGNILDFIEHKR